MQKMIALMFLVMALAGCARGSEGNGKNTSEQRTVTVNGEKPEDYYNRFLYRTSGYCHDHSIYFQYLSSMGLVLDDSLDGKPMRAELEVFLNKDRTYQANYEERKVRYFTENGYGYDIVFRKQISSTWNISENGQLVLNGIGVGSALKYNDRPAVMLTASVDIHQSGLKGQNIVLAMVYTSGSQELFDSVCKRRK